MDKAQLQKGFTLLEVLVVITLIGILSTVIFINVAETRKGARDDVRMADLQSLQVALELYKAEYGYYPAEGCGNNHPIAVNDTPDTVDWDGDELWTGPGPHDLGWGNECEEYISGLVPDFISVLPTDPNNEEVANWGFIYRTDLTGSSYKVLVVSTLESKEVLDYSNKFARCPEDFDVPRCDDSPPSYIYGIYSAGAEDW